MKKGEAQFKRMTEGSVEKLIATLSVPTVIAMLVTSVYNMADAYFVSQIGTSASGAVGVVFSLMAIIQAFGFALGMGSGSLIS
ncbi:MAG: MATE family efflux transporter, partial [Clostridia bacterium]|nr:MATE family efflux transporter [Clostridia bacterium]